MNQKEAMFALAYVMKEVEDVIESNKKSGKFFSSQTDAKKLVEAIEYLEEVTNKEWEELFQDLCDYIHKSQFVHTEEKMKENDLYYSIILTNAINKILGGEN